MTERMPPAYFERVRDRARKRWDQLESDPELAGPWRLLFKQVQSPRHVLSELLQNADDAGAAKASVTIHDSLFVFEHDGHDFNEEEFASLCRFGFSNKRNLHTVGFRGVGFKSTFSLGDVVEVQTPSLAVSFDKRRFTKPEWKPDAPACSVTRIIVQIQDEYREREVHKNLREWVESPASLLFFNHLEELTLGDVVLRKQVLGSGPVANSKRIRLSGSDEWELLLIASEEEAFPQAAVEEVRSERSSEDLELPPCRVELVVGLPGARKLYVVLPTGVTLDLPFSCNAPFIQDPARMGIKEPSLSPTNRWLLDRAGRLAAETMSEWLRNDSLHLKERAEAYCLLPDRTGNRDGLREEIFTSVSQGFQQLGLDSSVLLTADEEVARAGECLAPPPAAYAVWSNDEILTLFDAGVGKVLSGAITPEHRSRLQSWDWIQPLTDRDLWACLERGKPVPKPQTNQQLFALWESAQRQLTNDGSGDQRRSLAIVPVEGSNFLLSSKKVVRLPQTREGIDDAAWTFLVELVRLVDRGWIHYLGQLEGVAGTDSVRDLLRMLGLDRTSDLAAVMAMALGGLVAREKTPVLDCVLLAHLGAALDVKAASTMRYVTRDTYWRQASSGLVATADVGVDRLLPEGWANEHVLHDAYFRMRGACSSEQWLAWIRSGKSGTVPFPAFKSSGDWMRRSQLEEFLASRRAHAPIGYPYVTDDFLPEDYDWERQLIAYWEAAAREDETVWAGVLECTLASPVAYWRSGLQTSVSQRATTGTMRTLETGPIIPAWVFRFAGLKCLCDTYGQPHTPAELYLRTPETEPLIGVESFVSSDLDTEATKPLLRLLGVRDAPAKVDGLLERIRSLAAAPYSVMLLSDIVKWYKALEAATARMGADEIGPVREVFLQERLTLTDSDDWATSAEVSQYPGEQEMLEASVVHPAANDLTLWARIGVPAYPTAEAVVDWLKRLPSGQPMPKGRTARVRAALRAYPEEIWASCEHWLALDSTWQPVGSLRYRLSMSSLTEWSTFFAKTTASTADFRMLSQQTLEHTPFCDLLELSSATEYEVTKRPLAEDAAGMPLWLHALAGALVRVKVPEEDATNRIRTEGARLSNSVWHHYQGDDALLVTPYIGGAPCGKSFSPGALWYKTTIFVKDGRPAQCFDAVVRELAKPFLSREVTEAVKACYERLQPFVSDYMEEHFVLAEAQADGPTPDQSTEETELGGGTTPEVTPPVPGPSGAEPPGSGGGGGSGTGSGGSAGSGGGEGTSVTGGGETGEKTGGLGAGGGKRPPGSPSGRPFISSYVAVRHDEREAELDGPGHEARMELEERAIRSILLTEPQLKRTLTNNAGYDLFELGADGKEVRWIEVKSMSGGLNDRPVGLSHTQFDFARVHGKAYWIYIVEHAGSTGEMHLVRIQDPAGKARTFTFDRGWLDFAEKDAAQEEREA